MITFQRQQATYANPVAARPASSAVGFNATSCQPVDSVRFGGSLKDLKGRIAKLTETEYYHASGELTKEREAINATIGEAQARVREAKAMLALLRRDAEPRQVEKDNRRKKLQGKAAEENAREIKARYERQLAATNQAIADYNRLIDSFGLKTVPRLAKVSK